MELTMRRKIRDIIAKSLCEFDILNRHRDEYGSLRHLEPSTVCESICDECWFRADHILINLEDYINDDKQPAPGNR